jgi:rhomboid protease GluP
VFVVTLFDADQWIFAAFAVDEKVRQCEVWRLFTASFLHGGLLHLWLNCVALWAIGPAIERLYGKLKYVAAFLLTGAAGMTASVE